MAIIIFFMRKKVAVGKCLIIGGLFMWAVRSLNPELLLISGKEMLMRSGFATIIFTVILAVTDNLLYASMGLTLTSLFVMLVYDLRMKKYFEPERVKLAWKGIGGIYKACWPLFIASFIMNYLNNAPKYAINTYYDETVQNSYNILFMPAFVINLLSLFVFRPLLTDLAKDWEGDDMKAFTDIVKKMMALIGVLTVAACIGAYLLGIPVLSLIYGVDLSSYRLELVVVMICGGLNAYVYCLYYVVTVTGKQIYLLAGYGVGLAAAVLFGPLLVQRAGIMGAAVSCTLSFALVFAVFLLITAVVIRKKKTILN